MISPIGLILGSGWGGIIEKLKNRKEESFEKVFGFKTSVPGHSGKVIKGNLNGKKLIILSGRFHTYEDYSTSEVTKTIKYLHDQGVKKVIITSASGALNPRYRVGDLVILNDLITLFCPSPLSGPQFQNLSQPFNQKLIDLANNSAVLNNFPVQNGVYIYLKGPHFETFSDKMALRFLGADIVGMSTVPEVIMANYLGMEVLGLSMVTNLAFVKHNHQDVLHAAGKQSAKLKKILEDLIKKL